MEYIVGKPMFKSAISYGLFCIGWAMTLFIADAYKGMRLFSIVLIIITVFVVIPGISYCQLTWKVDDKQLCYTYHDNIIVKISSFMKHIFKNHRIEYQIQLNLDQLDYIAVTYAKIPRFPFGAYGYDILFEAHMLDGSLFTFESLVTTQRIEFNDAVAFMKEQGIQFKDKYGILTALQKETPISYYLEKMEKENHDQNCD